MVETPKKTFKQIILEKEFPGTNLDYLTDDNKREAVGGFLENFRSAGGIIGGIIRKYFMSKQSSDFTIKDIAEKVLKMGYVKTLEQAMEYIPEIVQLRGAVRGICKEGINLTFYKSAPIGNQLTYHLGNSEACLC